MLCFAGAVILGFEQVTSGKLLLSVLPLLSRHYWFTVAYIALYLVSPFINKMLNSLTKREYTWLVIGGAVLLSAWTTFIYFSAGVMTGGHTGLLWFMYIYCVGGYLRKNREYIPKKRFCIIGAIAAIMVLMGYSLLQKKFAFLQNFPVLQDDSIVILLISLFLFAAFLNVSIKSAWCQKLIKAIAVGAFGVYLIQESCMVRQGLWERLIKPEQYADKWYLIPLALLVVVCLFAAAFIGHRLFELLYKLVKNCLEKRSRKATQK